MKVHMLLNKETQPNQGKENSKKFPTFCNFWEFSFYINPYFATTQGTLTTITGENNHFLCVS